MLEPKGYNLSSYGDMISDRPRCDAYIQALRQSIHPGDVVVDIGSGTGIFSLVACQLGARKVYAIEPDDSILVAQEIARENGFSELITFIQDVSTAVSLPERADVIVSDLRGVLPLFQHHLASVIDARQRLLAPRGVLIPQKDILYAAIVENPELHRHFTSPWTDNPYQLSMRSPLQYTLNAWEKAKLTPDHLLSAPHAWVSLDYRSIAETNLIGVANLEIRRSGLAHGLGMWFDAELSAGIGFSNAPGAPQLIYGQSFFPFQTPIPVQVGNIIEVEIRADLVADDYIWAWKTRYLPEVKNDWDFEQSTFNSIPLSMPRLRKKTASFKPSLSAEGLVDRFILELMDGSTPLTEIAQAVAGRFPGRFTDWKAALSYTSDLSEKYSN